MQRSHQRTGNGEKKRMNILHGKENSETNMQRRRAKEKADLKRLMEEEASKECNCKNLVLKTAKQLEEVNEKFKAMLVAQHDQ